MQVFRYVQALDGPLGPILAPLGPIWPQNDLQKPRKKQGFKVIANAGFRYFEAIDGHLGPILAPLGPIWSQKWVPKWVPKCLQIDPKIT